MVVRGAPLIGATAAYGVALAMRADPSDGALDRAIAQLAATRPTAVNLRWALDAAGALLRGLPPGERETAAYAFAARLCEDDVRTNRSIGQFGLQIFRHIARQAGAGADGRELNVMTHCNAGWLATVDWGTATAPIYRAHDQGLRVHVWVRETRPRFQGAGLTAWELGQHGVPHTLVSDSAAGYLLSRGKVDVVIVGTRPHDRGRRCRQQGGHVSARARRAGQRCAVLRGGPVTGASTGRSKTAPRSRSKSATRTR